MRVQISARDSAGRGMLFLIFVCFFGFAGGANAMGNSETMMDIGSFSESPAWQLAQAVQSNDLDRIRSLCKNNPGLANTKDKKFGMTLLYWAVGTERFESAKVLLECGADPNVTTDYNGESPLFLAAGYSFIDRDAKKDPKFVRLLLVHHADPNVQLPDQNSTPLAKSWTNGERSSRETGLTPLMNSLAAGIEKTKAIVEAGADIELRTESGRTAATIALIQGEVEQAYYLIVEKKADVTRAYRRSSVFSTTTGVQAKNQFYPIENLRNWIFPLNSKEFQMKEAIVAEFSRQGVDYAKVEVQAFQLQKIKRLYPESWSEYLEKY